MRRDLSLRRRILALVIALAGCNSGLCARKSDCAAGQTCTSAGLCVRTSDAGGDDDDSGGEDASTDATDAAVDAPVDQVDAAVGDPP
jgi:hypothetical protein